MMPKLPEKKAGPLCRLPQLFLKRKPRQEEETSRRVNFFEYLCSEGCARESSSAKAPVIEIFDALDS
jgi:hypothetical protein